MIVIHVEYKKNMQTVEKILYIKNVLKIPKGPKKERRLEPLE